MHFKIKIRFSIAFLNVNMHCNRKTTSKQSYAFQNALSKLQHGKTRVAKQKCAFQFQIILNLRLK